MVHNPEATLGFIKPMDPKKQAMAAQQSREDIEAARLHIASEKTMRLTADQARALYDEHKNLGHFQELIDYVTGGDIIAFFIVGDGAIEKWRNIIGTTKNPALGTIRANYGENFKKNGAHGSSSKESANYELPIIFPNIAPQI